MQEGALGRGIKCWQFFVGHSYKKGDKLDSACEASGAYNNRVLRVWFAKDVIFEKTKI